MPIVPTRQVGITHPSKVQAVRETPELDLDIEEAGACVLGACGRRFIQGVGSRLQLQVRITWGLAKNTDMPGPYPRQLRELQ